MRWHDIGDIHCSVARSLSVVGDRWTLLVLRDCFRGVRRFDDFLKVLGVSPHVLSTRLARLVEHGVLERRPYREKPVRYEYRLTEKGVDLYPVIVGLLRWGDRWMADEKGPPVELVHRACGHRIHPQLACPECGEPVDPRSMRPVMKPHALTNAASDSRAPRNERDALGARD
jgi:DNA-binding HxlR family transcriptional regulator